MYGYVLFLYGVFECFCGGFEGDEQNIYHYGYKHILYTCFQVGMDIYITSEIQVNRIFVYFVSGVMAFNRMCKCYSICDFKEKTEHCN